MSKNVRHTEMFIEPKNPRVFIEIKNPRMFVEGRMEKDDEFSHVVFRKIPYAQPPIGKRRFQPPEPYQVPTNEGEIEHHVDDNVEIEDDRVEQMKKDEQTREGQETGISMGETESDLEVEKSERSRETEDIQPEDCLYLTVYLPRAPTMKKRFPPLPVLVYFLGKAFRKGRGKYDDIMPEFFMRQDIIVVLVNYRLGPFGFLNMHHPKCTGNAGLKDQVMALTWVRDNIAVFGGDTENITIAGHSFGGSCVNVHLMSPLSRNLFHKAIIQSGGMFCPWGLRGHLNNACSMYEQCWSMDGLMKADAADILEFDEGFVQYHLSADHILAPHLGPSVESFKDGSFLHIPREMSLLDLMKQAKPVPILAGIAEEEGYDGIIDETFDVDALKKMIKDDTHFCSFLMSNLYISEEVTRIHLDSLRKRYFEDIDSLDSMSTKYGFAKLLTDIAFHRFYQNFKLGEHGSVPLYIYTFDYPTKSDPRPEYRRLMDQLSCYGNSLPHSYSPHMMEQNKKKVIYSFWANFCKTGSPSSAIHKNLHQWLPHTDKKPCYLHIRVNYDKLNVMNGFLNANRWNYLNDMAEEDYFLYLVFQSEQKSRDSQRMDNSGIHGSHPSSSQLVTSTPLEYPKGAERSNSPTSNYSSETHTPQRVEKLDNSKSRGRQPSSSRSATSMRRAAISKFWESNFSNIDSNIIERNMRQREEELLALITTRQRASVSRPAAYIPSQHMRSNFQTMDFSTSCSFSSSPTYVRQMVKEVQDFKTMDTSNLGSHGSEPLSSGFATCLPLKPSKGTVRSNFDTLKLSKINMDALGTYVVPQMMEPLLDIHMMDHSGSYSFQQSTSLFDDHTNEKSRRAQSI